MIKPDGIKIKNYELILSEDCNLRCTYCFDNRRSDRSQEFSKKFKMSIDMIPDLMFFIKETRDPNARLNFSLFGGEPVYNWKFLVALVIELRRKYRNDVDISIVTNVTLLDTNKIDFLVYNNVGMTLSIDGIKEANAKRVNKLGKNSWEEIVQKLPEILSKTKSVNLSMVVNSENYIYLYDSYRFLLSLHKDVEVLFDLQDNFSDEILDSIEKDLHNLFIRDRLIPYRNIRRILNTNYINGNGVCGTAEKTISIKPSGDLYFCHVFAPKMTSDENDSLSYGNIRDGYINPETYNQFYKESYRSNNFSKDNKCYSCEIKSWCKGGCIAENYFFNDSFGGINDNICRINFRINSILKKLKEF